MLHIVQCSFRLLAMLAKNHHGNSKYLFDNIDAVRKYMLGYRFGVAECLTEIFRCDVTRLW